MSPSPLEGREKVGRGREGRRREEREWVREVNGRGEEREWGKDEESREKEDTGGRGGREVKGGKKSGRKRERKRRERQEPVEMLPLKFPSATHSSVMSWIAIKCLVLS